MSAKKDYQGLIGPQLIAAALHGKHHAYIWEVMELKRIAETHAMPKRERAILFRWLGHGDEAKGMAKHEEALACALKKMLDAISARRGDYFRKIADAVEGGFLPDAEDARLACLCFFALPPYKQNSPAYIRLCMRRTLRENGITPSQAGLQESGPVRAEEFCGFCDAVAPLRDGRARDVDVMRQRLRRIGYKVHRGRPKGAKGKNK